MKGKNTTTVGSLCVLGNGHGFGPKTWSESGLPIIRIQNLNGSSEFNYYSGKPDPSWIVDPGTILFSWAGTKGVSFGAFRWNGPKGVLNQHIFKVTPRTGVDKDWLFHALRLVTERIEKKAHGFKSTLLHVRRSDVVDQEIYAPAEAEQKEISQKIGLSERLASISECLLDAVSNRRRGLTQQLLTGKRRFPEFAAPQESVKWAFGTHPSDWPLVRMAEVGRECSERGAAEAEVLSCSKHRGFVLSREYFDRQVFSEDRSNYKVIRRGQFGYPSNHIEEGSIGLQTVCDVGVVSPIYTVFQTDDRRVVPEFLIRMLKTELYRHIFQVNTNASVDRRGSLRWDEFKEIQVALPTIKEQHRIVAFFDLIDREMALCNRLVKAGQDLKQGLMQQLLTGKRRVKIQVA